MPLSFRFSPATKIIRTRATGIVNFDDIVHHLQAKEQQQVLSYAEIFDTRGAQFDLSICDISQVVDEVRRVMSSTTPGPLAVVTTSNFIRGLARAYASLTIHDHPAFEIFDNVEEAQSWIARAAVGFEAGAASDSDTRKRQDAPPITTAQ
jgi:hypothetical protein